MSKIGDIRDAIKAVMDQVPDVGQVHTFERFAKRASAFKAFYEDQDQIRGWYIRRVSTLVKADGLNSLEETYTWQIRGYMSVSDETQSERQFDDLVELLRLQFIANDNLNGVVKTCRLPGQAGLQVVKSGHVMLSGVLCHEIELKLGCLVRA